MITQPAQAVSALKVSSEAMKEITEFSPIAEESVLEVQKITIPATASAAQGDFVKIVNKAGTSWGVWLDIDADGTAPSGLIYTGCTYKVKASIVTGGSAIDNALIVKTAIELEAHWAQITITNNLDGTLTLTSTKVGNVTAPTPKNSAESGAGSIGAETVTGGVASNLQNKYIVLKTHAAVLYHAWLNVNSEGVNPAPEGSTQIPVAVPAGASINAIAGLFASAINAVTGVFQSTSQKTGTFQVTNVVSGTAVDATAGNSGFTVKTLQQGAALVYSPEMSPESLSISPSLIS
jgi:hypothetical protein